MQPQDDGYRLQFAFGPGGLPTEAACAVITGYDVQRRHIIGKYYGSGEPRAANSYQFPASSSAGDWWHGLTQDDWNEMWFNQPEELWSTLYRGNRSGDSVNPTGHECDAAPRHIALLWDPDRMMRDGNDIYSQWEELRSLDDDDDTTLTENRLTCTDPPTTGYAVSVYVYQYRVRAVNGEETSDWTEYRFTTVPSRAGAPGNEDDEPAN